MPGVHVSPFGVIPKSELGRWHLILDLSSPDRGSVNDGITKEFCSLSYLSVDKVAAGVVRLGRGALMAKFHLKAAYRNVPVHPDDRWLLGMVWEDQLFLMPPIWPQISSHDFHAVADALAFIIKRKGVGWLEHYLDDFVVLGPQSWISAEVISRWHWRQVESCVCQWQGKRHWVQQQSLHCSG